MKISTLYLGWAYRAPFIWLGLLGGLFWLAAPTAALAQTCDPDGNLIIFTNYDGGQLNIRIDADIPDLKIGICTYEPVRVNISGPFSGNVSRVLYAGLNSTQNNNNCGLGNFPTSITGVPAANTSILTAPPVTLTNPNGNNGGIICAYTCNSNIDQGGCNTIDQIEDFFSTQLGGTLYSLQAQYCCWLGSNTYSVSSLGGACCISANAPATIAYDGPFCASIATPQAVILNGSPVGTYSASPAGLILDPISGAITPAGSSLGTYTVTYSLPGCPSTITATTTVTISNPVPAPVASPNATYCTSEAIPPLSATTSAGGTLSWYSDAALSNLLATGPTLPITPGPGSTTYYVTQTVAGCESPATTVTITITPNSQAAFSYAQPAYCQQDANPSPLISGTAGGAFSSFPDGLSIDAATGQIDLLSSLPNNYSVVYASPPPCASTDTVSLVLLPQPQVQIRLGESLCGQSVSLSALGTGTFTWSTQELGNSIVVRPSQPTTYCVSAALDGCTASDCIVVSIDFSCCELFVPNAFSPNSDGVNDDFSPFSSCFFEQYQLSIFDRWGQLVFKTSNAEDAWDGKFKAQPCEPGVYVYVLNIRFSPEESRELSGSLTLVR